MRGGLLQLRTSLADALWRDKGAGDKGQPRIAYVRGLPGREGSRAGLPPRFSQRKKFLRKIYSWLANQRTARARAGRLKRTRISTSRATGRASPVGPVKARALARSPGTP